MKLQKKTYELEITVIFSHAYIMCITDLSLLPFHTCILPGSLVSPSSVPYNLDGNKGVERRPSKSGVSRESSSVDFSKVI